MTKNNLTAQEHATDAKAPGADGVEPEDTKDEEAEVVTTPVADTEATPVDTKEEPSPTTTAALAKRLTSPKYLVIWLAELF